jgi:hypothetical protein
MGLPLGRGIAQRFEAGQEEQTVSMKIALPLLISSLLVAGACGEPPDYENRQGVAAKRAEKGTTKPLASRTVEQQQKEDYEAQLKVLRDSYLQSIEDLKAKAQNSSTEAQEDLASSFGELQEKTQTVNTILEKLDAAGVESWRELKPEIHAALDHLEASYYKAVSQLVYDEQQQAANRGADPPKELMSVKAEGR